MSYPAGRIPFLYGRADSPPLGSRVAAAPGYFACQIILSDNELPSVIAVTKTTRNGNAAAADAGFSFPKGYQFPQTLTGNIRTFLFLTATVCNGTLGQVILIDRDLMSACTLTDPISGSGNL